MQTESNTTFASLQLAEPILRALADKQYTHPSPIEAQAIPHLLAGRDLVGCAQTGTGKTAAVALPMLHRFSTQALAAGALPDAFAFRRASATRAQTRGTIRRMKGLSGTERLNIIWGYQISDPCR